MGKQQDNSDNKSVDENDKVITKLIAFTYETSHLNELEIYFESKSLEEKSDGKCTMNKKQKRKKNLNENVKFQTFSLPRWFSNDSTLSGLAVHSYIFYMNFKDSNMLDKKYQIVQKFDRGKITGGVGNYYSDSLILSKRKSFY